MIRSAWKDLREALAFAAAVVLLFFGILLCWIFGVDLDD